MTRYSVVIPCYCSGKWTLELVQRIDKALRASGESFEILLVNDASPDDSWQQIDAAAKQFSFVRGIDLLFNVGQYRATLCGLENARGEFIITMDDDLQHPPEELPKLIAGIQENPQWDCVLGRYERKQHGWFRNLGSALMRGLYVRFYSAPRDVWPSSFRIMTRQFAQALCQHRTANPIICPMIFQTTRRVGNVDVRHDKRSYGKSGYRLVRLMATVADTVIRGTTYPLHAISCFGLLIALGAAGLELYYLIRYFSDPTMLKGFTTLVLLITFFGGMTLFAIGLVGEYLARVIEEVRRPPRYVIRQQVFQNSEAVAQHSPGSPDVISSKTATGS